MPFQPPPPFVRADVPLAPLTTLEVGGSAQHFAAVSTPEELGEALRWARAAAVPTFILGGGSNLLVSDDGFAGLVLQYKADKLTVTESQESVHVRADAGLTWDAFVEMTTKNGWSGVECLSGIPGWVGATPIQNVGAYGQEIANTIIDVDAVHKDSGAIHRFANHACGFGYRTSNFKAHWQNAYVVTSVRFRVVPGDAAPACYPELQAHLGGGEASTPAQVREAVLTLRRRKSMLWDEADPNHRSAGSFFMNPIVPSDQANAMRAKHGDKMPAYPAAHGFTKLSAAWLIEHAGLTRGYVHAGGKSGLSTHHTLAIINIGDARAQDILEMAAHVQRTVAKHFNVTLVPEAQGLGFAKSLQELLSLL